MKPCKIIALALWIPLSSIAATHAAAPANNVKTSSGWDAFSTLQTGNMRYFEGHLQHPNQDSLRREALASGQQPHTIVVSCSDSRVPPEEIFDQGLGDLFTVRLAGNVMTTEAIASIEYAIEHLGSKLLIVMGHESCGAVGTAVASSPGVSNGSESLDVLVRQIRGNPSSASIAAAGSDKTFRQGVKENVAASLRSLLQKSEIVRSAIAKNGFLVGQAIYGLKSGRVEFWDVGRPVEGGAPPEKIVIKEQTVVEETIAVDKKPKVLGPPPQPARSKALAH